MSQVRTGEQPIADEEPDRTPHYSQLFWWHLHCAREETLRCEERFLDVGSGQFLEYTRVFQSVNIKPFLMAHPGDERIEQWRQPRRHAMHDGRPVGELRRRKLAVPGLCREPPQSVLHDIYTEFW